MNNNNVRPLKYNGNNYNDEEINQIINERDFYKNKCFELNNILQQYYTASLNNIIPQSQYMAQSDHEFDKIVKLFDKFINILKEATDKNKEDIKESNDNTKLIEEKDNKAQLLQTLLDQETAERKYWRDKYIELIEKGMNK